MFGMDSDGPHKDKMTHVITEIENTQVHEYNGTQVLQTCNLKNRVILQKLLWEFL